ncbi:CoxG family protein [Neobacillus dielmonensis]|uniref:CoxG family protein n=1 Tax=Neobacillus dielmonensis TaxID=1347369 RepID=UPI0005A9C4ED|nr:SRPBCC family protein [Neobacillus dielmonensis]
MPSGIHQVEINVPINVIWEFVKDMDNWAPLVPNYVSHEKLTERTSTWEFKSDIGIIKKKISLLIDIIEWLEPTKVCFTLKGQKDKYSGEGYFEAKAINHKKTKLTGYLEVNVNGKLSSAVNSKLESVLPEAVEEMANAISSKLVELISK